MSVRPQSIRIYRLLDSQVLIANAPTIAKEVFKMASLDAGERTFRVSAGGILSFAHHGQLGRNTSGTDLPRTPGEAVGAANDFLRRAGNVVGRSPALRSAGITSLLPAEVRPLQVKLVANAAGVADHWLCRFNIWVQTGISGLSAQLYGGMIVLRIGVGGEVIGCTVRWRPCVSDEPVSMILNAAFDIQTLSSFSAVDPPAATPIQKIEAGIPNERATASPVLVYLLGDDHVAQSFLTPFYVSGDEDELEFSPASTYSMLAQIDAVYAPEGFKASAVVMGGSGNFDYRWASWSPTNFRRGVQERGSSKDIDIEGGAHNLILRVGDRATGQTASVEALVF